MLYRKDELEKELHGCMRLALEGDPVAYENLLSTVAKLVRGYLMNSIRGREGVSMVEDLVQEVLLAIHIKKHLYRSDQPILPWIFAIARYKLIDAWRADKRRPSLVSLDAEPEGMGGLEPAEPLHAQMPEWEDLLEGLTDRQKEILSLAKRDGMPLSQVAQKMNMSLSAIKVAIHRAIKLLRERHKSKQ